MRVSAVSAVAQAKVRVAKQAAPPLVRNALLACGLVAFVGGAYMYTVAKMTGGGELAAVAAELEGFRAPPPPAGGAPAAAAPLK